MPRVFGIKAEYGITVDGAEQIDAATESIALVRSYIEQGASTSWDNASERVG